MFTRTFFAVMTMVLVCASASFGQYDDANIPRAAKGPSSSQASYLDPVHHDVRVRAILTVGDRVPAAAIDRATRSDYHMVGSADGLATLTNDDGTFTLFMTHQLLADQGVARAHGSRGAFISRWTIDPKTLRVIDGRDQIRKVHLWNTQTKQHEPSAAAFTRLSLGDLPAATAFYDRDSKSGTQTPLLLTGELDESGRAFASIVAGPEDGVTYELPALGRLKFRNILASPTAMPKTVLVALDRDRQGFVYVYVGEKRKTGSDIERAGLADGRLYVLAVERVPLEDRRTGINAAELPFTLIPLGDVRGRTAMQLRTDSTQKNGTRFLGPADGAWDTLVPNDFYFATSDDYDQTADAVGHAVGRSRLWRLRFTDIGNPERGGAITALLTGGEPIQMIDSVAINDDRIMLLQEDTFDTAHNDKLWCYDPSMGELNLLARHDPKRFGDLTVEPARPFTRNTASAAGVDVARHLGRGWFLVTVKARYDTGDGETVQGGQLLAIFARIESY